MTTDPLDVDDDVEAMRVGIIRTDRTVLAVRADLLADGTQPLAVLAADEARALAEQLLRLASSTRVPRRVPRPPD